MSTKSSKVMNKKEKAVAKKPVKEVESEESEEDVPAPVVQKNAKQNGKKATKKQPEPEPESESSEEEAEAEAEESPEENGEEAEEEEEDVPVLTKRKASDQSVGDEKRQKTAEAGAVSTVFVGRVSDSVDDDKIKEFFSECGTILNIRWNIDRETGAFKGCGWIDFDTPEAAQKAVEMAGSSLEGKNIHVDIATPRGERTERPAQAAEGNTVFIKNFGTEADEESVVAAINTIAEPVSYRLAKDRDSGAFRGFGHFDFADTETAQKVIEGLNGYEFQGNNLAAELSAPRTSGGGRGGGRGGGFGGGRGGGFGGGRGGGFGGGGRGGGFGGGRGGRGGGFGGGRGGGFGGGGRGGRGGGFGGGRGGGRGRF